MSRNTNSFTKHPNALHRLYTRLPDFQPIHALAYVVLVDYFNEDYGYAWPTQYELYLRLNCGVNTPAKVMETLEDYELIYRKKVNGKNYVYVPREPIDNETEFYARWPEAKTHYDARVEYIAGRKAKSEEDLRQFIEEIRRKECAKVGENEPESGGEDAGEDGENEDWVSLFG